ncbi:MAG: protein kinase family protein [Bacteroidales bacterium]|nr:protein kinase family protein [Bacteroidales bacterium]
MDRTAFFFDDRMESLSKSESNYYRINRIINPYAPGPDFSPYDESRIGFHQDGRKFKILDSYVNGIGDGGLCGLTSYIIKDIYDYTIEKQIGEGSHGSLWKAHYINDSGEREIVCIKMAKPGFEDALKKEYETLKVWNHPCIISPIDLYEDNGKICMVMPYYEKTAFSIKGKCDNLSAWRFCESMASALEYIHNRGMVHKDVKLSNILVGPEDRYILSDFSCMTKSASIIEDDWMFGRSIFELVTGKPAPSFNLEDRELDHYFIRDSEMKSLIKFCMKEIPISHRNHDPFVIQDMPAEYTDYVEWTMVNDFCVVQKGDKYGLLNRFGTLVIPIEYDSLSCVDYYPDFEEETVLRLRCLFKKGNTRGSFLIDRDFAIKEIEYQSHD